MNLEQARFNMIEQQIRPWDVLDTEVLHLLSVVKREDFVPLAHKALAFVDMEIPLGHAQVMLAPRVEARMLQDAAVQKHEKVLELGSGSGYVDGSIGAPAEGPFDVIMLCGSVAEAPQTLLSNLKIGGRLIAIVGNEPMMRATLITRTGEADFKTSQPWDTVAPRLLGFPEPSHFTF